MEAAAGEPAEDWTAEAGGFEGVFDADLDARLERWAAAARVAQAAGGRRREQWLRHQAGEEGNFAGALVDLAEWGAPVAVHLRGGRMHTGHVRAVGKDFLALELDDAVDAFVALSAVAAVVAGPGAPVTVGDRHVAPAFSLAQVIVGLCGERERVSLITVDGACTVAGTLVAVGQDVVTVARDGGCRGGTAYVPITMLAEVIVGAA